jgi:hypothetical protein
MAVTSASAGAFFENRDEVVIDYRTLTRLLRACDGDTTYVLDVIHRLPELTSDLVSRQKIEVRVGDEVVNYEGVTVRGLLDFGRSQFTSGGLRERLVSDMLEAGGRPLDVLRRRGLLAGDRPEAGTSEVRDDT